MPISASKGGRGSSEVPSQSNGPSLNSVAQLGMGKQVEDQLLTELPAWMKRWPNLKNELRQVAWIGSLAHGGFSEFYSDFDLALFFAPSARDAEIKSQLADLVSQLPTPDRWSMFWAKIEPRLERTEPPEKLEDTRLQIGRFPSLDQVDYLDHGLVIWDADGVQSDVVASRSIDQALQSPKEASAQRANVKRLGFARPTQAEIREHLRQESIPYWSGLLTHIESHISSGMSAMRLPDKSLVRLALYPSRFHFTWFTGRVDANESAIRFCETRHWYDQDLVEAAMYFRRLRLNGDLATEKEDIETHFKVVTDIERLRTQLMHAFAEVA